MGAVMEKIRGLDLRTGAVVATILIARRRDVKTKMIPR